MNPIIATWGGNYKLILVSSIPCLILEVKLKETFNY